MVTRVFNEMKHILHKTLEKRSPAISHGFTLVEMLGVLLVIGILMSMLISGYASLAEKARRTKAVEIAKQLKDAWDLYLIQNMSFPDNLMDLNVENGWYKTDMDFIKFKRDRDDNYPDENEHLKYDVSNDELAAAERKWGKKGLLDPWGNYYLFRLDTGCESQVPHPNPNTGKVNGHVIVWTYGPDKKPGNKDGEQWPDPAKGQKPPDDIVVW